MTVWNKGGKAGQPPLTMPADLAGLTDEQVIAWYSKHPHPTVRACVERLKQALTDAQEACIQAYEEGLRQAKPQTHPHGLVESEVRLADRYTAGDGQADGPFGFEGM